MLYTKDLVVVIDCYIRQTGREAKEVEVDPLQAGQSIGEKDNTSSFGKLFNEILGFVICFELDFKDITNVKSVFSVEQIFSLSNDFFDRRH